MARARNIKPGFFKNEVLAELSMETRMLFIGLWTLSDREGRLEDRPKRVKMELFPYDSFDVDPMLSSLQDEGFLVRYEVDGIRYIQIQNFVKHQDPHYKEKASEIPPPDGFDNVIKAIAVTRGQRSRILSRDNYVCQSCGSKETLCIDHVIPVSRGGDSSDDNLQVLCHSCNTKKGNRLDGEDRGVKKSKHHPSAVITQFNVDSNLNQRNGSMPSDSLIPDSLIPDSLIPDVLIPDVLIPDSSGQAAVIPIRPEQQQRADEDESMVLTDLNDADFARAAGRAYAAAWGLESAPPIGFTLGNTICLRARSYGPAMKIKWWGWYFELCREDEFLNGTKNPGFIAGLQYLVKEENFARVINANHLETARG